MKLVILTQVWENYAWREDGTLGVGDEAYWKAKGGDEYVVRGIKNEEEATMAVMALRNEIETANDGYMESVIGWDLIGEAELTEFEKSQLEYDGSIMFPAKELVWA